MQNDTRAAFRGRIQVAHIIGNAALGGVAACVLNYLAHIDRDRFRFDFITYGPSPFDEKVRAIDPDARVFTIPALDKTFYKAVPALTKILAEGGYTVAHSHMTTLSAFALRAAAKAGVPVRICHAHSTFDRQSDHFLIKAFLRPFAAKCATHRMACGRDAAENLFRKRADETYLLPNAIDLTRFAPGGEEAKRALGLEGRVLLFVGRFAYQKNLFFLLEAFAESISESPSTLVMVGDGPLKEALARRAEDLNIGKRVCWIPPCDPAPYYAAADAFCLPSLYEGFPVVGVEAQAAGLKCLFSEKVTREADLLGNAEYLPHDARAWARAMTAPCGKTENATEILRKKGFDIAEAAPLLTDFYERALKETR